MKIKSAQHILNNKIRAYEQKVYTISSFNVGFSSMFAEEHPDVVFTGTPWGIMGVSGNGRYIVGTRQYTEAYRFDIQEERLMVVPTQGGYDDMCFSDVTDDGMIVGKDHDMLPGIYRPEKEAWEKLPIPYTAITEGYANEVNPEINLQYEIESTAVEAVNGVVICVENRNIIAPEEAKVYSLQGYEVAKENVEPGIYVVVYNETVTKVSVR